MSQEYWSGEAKYVKRPSQVPKCVLVCPKVGFKPAKQVFKPVSKKHIASTSGNKKKDVEPTKENVETSSPSNTPIVDKIRKFEKLIIDRKDTLVDDEVNVIFGTNSLLEQRRDSYENAIYYYDPNEDDIYDGQEIPGKIQSICDKLDIKVRGRKKK
uniref:Uncharacterized protein n=1 Tax=Tanacetum cinerariifolium TaxID=118510 RepID=A0A6L2KZC6_TANCI|nr:hypothetical protein [Tanacetum cinerariifolium]